MVFDDSWEFFANFSHHWSWWSWELIAPLSAVDSPVMWFRLASISWPHHMLKSIWWYCSFVHRWLFLYFCTILLIYTRHLWNDLLQLRWYPRLIVFLVLKVRNLNDCLIYCSSILEEWAWSFCIYRIYGCCVLVARGDRSRDWRDRW